MNLNVRCSPYRLTKSFLFYRIAQILGSFLEACLGVLLFVIASGALSLVAKRDRNSFVSSIVQKVISSDNGAVYRGRCRKRTCSCSIMQSSKIRETKNPKPLLVLVQQWHKQYHMNLQEGTVSLASNYK